MFKGGNNAAAISTVVNLVIIPCCLTHHRNVKLSFFKFFFYFFLLLFQSKILTMACLIYNLSTCSECMNKFQVDALDSKFCLILNQEKNILIWILAWVLCINVLVSGKRYIVAVCRHWCYKTFFILNSTEHKISTAHKNYKKDKWRSFLL